MRRLRWQKQMKERTEAARLALENFKIQYGRSPGSPAELDQFMLEEREKAVHEALSEIKKKSD